ncbi:MAG: hypothetical protein GY862_16565 [Gammaproteobacteria bacterium]|nr:hypothetical protein [Gammaproteobacteria bacterium]
MNRFTPVKRIMPPSLLLVTEMAVIFRLLSGVVRPDIVRALQENTERAELPGMNRHSASHAFHCHVV